MVSLWRREFRCRCKLGGICVRSGASEVTVWAIGPSDLEKWCESNVFGKGPVKLWARVAIAGTDRWSF